MMKKSPVLSEVEGFTLMEIIIVTAIIVLLAIAALLLLNPLRQIEKSWDTKRKAELATLTKVNEDWYNDHNCYPKPGEICYDTAVNNECHICGNEVGSPSFSPYLSRLPCDPQQSKNPYLYQTDSGDCPSWYKIYASLADGPTGYNYEVGSPNSPDVTPASYPTGLVATPTPTIFLPPTATPTTGIPPPPNTPLPTKTPTPPPNGAYYCQSLYNCSWYDKNLWNCSPNFADPLCTGSGNCTIHIGSCVPK